MQKIHHALFDLDGTLVDSSGAIQAASVLPNAVSMNISCLVALCSGSDGVPPSLRLINQGNVAVLGRWLPQAHRGVRWAVPSISAHREDLLVTYWFSVGITMSAKHMQSVGKVYGTCERCLWRSAFVNTKCGALGSGGSEGRCPSRSPKYFGQEEGRIWSNCPGLRRPAFPWSPTASGRDNRVRSGRCPTGGASGRRCRRRCRGRCGPCWR